MCDKPVLRAYPRCETKSFPIDLNLDNSKVRGGGYGVCSDGEEKLY